MSSSMSEKVASHRPSIINKQLVPSSPHTLVKKFWEIVPTRYVVVLIAAMANAIEYTLRANLSITIVAMVRDPSSPSAADSNVTSLQHMNTSDVMSSPTSPGAKGGEFDWSPTTQGIILGSFYYGYVVTHLAGGQLAQMMGAKKLIAISLFVSSSLTLLTPAACYFNVIAVIILRIITGLSQGVMTPAVYTMFSQWIPQQERGIALAVIVVGGNVGALVTMPLSGFLCEHGFAGGWGSVFYILGISGSVCFVAWLYFIYNTPEEHPRISESELSYIRQNLETASMEIKAAPPKVPWVQILTSRSVWAIAAAKFTGSWGYYVLMTKLPAYMASVLKFPIEMNGTVNAFVYIAMSISVTASGYLSDLLEKRKAIDKNVSRKLFETIALVGPALGMTLVPFVGLNSVAVVALLIISMTFYGCYGGGDNPAVIDVAPDFSGSVYGLTSAIGSIPGFLAPIFVGYMLDLDPGNPLMWDYVFYAASAIYMVGAIIFLLFGSTKSAKWGVIASDDSRA